MTTMTQRLVILGTGGSAYDVLEVVEAINKIVPTWSIAGFLDDARAPGSHHVGFPILGRLTDAGKLEDCLFVNSIGSDKSYRHRANIVMGTHIARERFATVVHPGAAVSAYARVGLGVHINHGVSVGGGAAIGDHVFLGPGCIVGHDCVIEDYSIVAPGAIISGFVQVEQNSYIGAGASIRQNTRIGAQALVGMGAVVVRDVEAGDTVVGNPARSLRQRRES